MIDIVPFPRSLTAWAECGCCRVVLPVELFERGEAICVECRRHCHPGQCLLGISLEHN